MVIGDAASCRAECPPCPGIEGPTLTSRIHHSPARGLVRAVAAAFALKLLGILVLYGMFFAPAHRPTVDPDRWFDAAVEEPSP